MSLRFLKYICNWGQWPKVNYI